MRVKKKSIRQPNRMDPLRTSISIEKLNKLTTSNVDTFAKYVEKNSSISSKILQKSITSNEIPLKLLTSFEIPQKSTTSQLEKKFEEHEEACTHRVDKF